jgi:hypothetical protein
MLCTVLLVDGILSRRLLVLNGISVSRFRDFLSDTLLVLGIATVLLSILQPFPRHQDVSVPRRSLLSETAKHVMCGN